MKSETFLTGRIIKKYKMPLEEVQDLNEKYTKAKENLENMGHRLAGRIESELSIVNIIQGCKIFDSLTKAMKDYIDSGVNYKLYESGEYNLNIISCWVNDMKEGEYNPPHTHYDSTGWSTVLFLKVPEFVNNLKVNEHKFKDGKILFIGVDGHGITDFFPEVGDFYIFEAKHMHCVMPFKVKEKNKIRRSMSFNFIRNKIEIPNVKSI